MPHEVRGVVATGAKQPVSVETIIVPDPGPGEALVRVQACGVCHTDLHYREGGISDDFPFLLGHEAAGVVEAVGDDVTGVAVGDFVVLNWRAVCGECRSCRRGRPDPWSFRVISVTEWPARASWPAIIVAATPSGAARRGTCPQTTATRITPTPNPPLDARPS